MNLKIWSINNILVLADTREDAREAYFAFERDYDYDDIP